MSGWAHGESLPALPLAACWRALRARQWAHFAVLPLAGLPLPGDAPLAEPAAHALRGVITASFALAYAYGLNAVTDRGMDASADKNPLAGLRARPGRALALVLACGAAAAALAAAAGLLPLAAASISMAASTVYSAGPRLKALLGIGTACNVAIFAPLLLLSLPPAGPPPGFAHLAVVFTGLLLQNQLLHERADADEDARGGVQTTARALGERGTAAAVALIGAAAAGLGAPLAAGKATALIGAAALALGAMAAFPLGTPAAIRRARHRAVAALGGASVFLAGWLLSGGAGG